VPRDATRAGAEETDGAESTDGKPRSPPATRPKIRSAPGRLGTVHGLLFLGIEEREEGDRRAKATPDCAAHGSARPAGGAATKSYPAGSFIIPADTTYQDYGMFTAYGLAHDLLRAGVPVDWVIEPGKAYGGVDLTTSAEDLQSGQPITDHGYRGGPFVVDAAHAAVALPGSRRGRRRIPGQPFTARPRPSSRTPRGSSPPLRPWRYWWMGTRTPSSRT